MYIPNDDLQNYPFCGLKLVVETFEWINQSKFTKVPKVVKPAEKETLVENFGD